MSDEMKVLFDKHYNKMFALMIGGAVTWLLMFGSFAWWVQAKSHIFEESANLTRIENERILEELDDLNETLEDIEDKLDR